MPFNPQAILNQMEQDFLNMGLTKVPVYLSITTIFLNNASDALTKIDQSYAQDRDDDFLNARLSEQKDIFLSQYLGLKIISEQIASDVRDQTLQTVATTLITVLGQLLTNGVK